MRCASKEHKYRLDTMSCNAQECPRDQKMPWAADRPTGYSLFCGGCSYKRSEKKGSICRFYFSGQKCGMRTELNTEFRCPNELVDGSCPFFGGLLDEEQKQFAFNESQATKEGT